MGALGPDRGHRRPDGISLPRRAERVPDAPASRCDGGPAVCSPVPEDRDGYVEAEMRADVRRLLLRSLRGSGPRSCWWTCSGIGSEQAARILRVRPSTVRNLVSARAGTALRSDGRRCGMPDVQEVFRMSTQKVRPDPGFTERQEQRQRRTARNRKLGAFAVVAVIGGDRGGRLRDAAGWGRGPPGPSDEPPHGAADRRRLRDRLRRRRDRGTHAEPGDLHGLGQLLPGVARRDHDHVELVLHDQRPRVRGEHRRHPAANESRPGSSTGMHRAGPPTGPASSSRAGKPTPKRSGSCTWRMSRRGS